MKPVRLNLGSGWHRLEGYINVDLHYDADVKADLRNCEFAPDSADEIVSAHTIEHLTREDGAALLRRCLEWLKPGGLLVIETPDATKCRALLPSRPLEGAKGLRGGRSVNKKGWHEWLIQWAEAGADLTIPDPPEWNLPGEPHLYVWTGGELATEFHSAGFVDVRVDSPQYHGFRKWRDSRISGWKPPAPLTLPRVVQ